MRPFYETEADRRNQREAIRSYLKSFVGWTAEERPVAEVWDFDLMQEGVHKAVAEVKCRDRVTSDLMERWGDYMLSAEKWDAIEQLCHDRGLQFHLVVRLSDALYRFITPYPFPEVARAVGGRSDRGDSADQELCVFIPWEWFWRC